MSLVADPVQEVIVAHEVIQDNEADEQQERKETGFFGRRRESKKFDDGFDLPEFLQ